MPSASLGRIVLDTKRLDAIAAKLDTNADGAVGKIAKQVEAETKKNIQIKNVIDTGNFFNSILAEPIRSKFWWVHDGTEYGIYLELGTYKMTARPTMTPALETVAKQIGAVFAKELIVW